MTNRPKAIGTTGETRVVNWLQAYGFENAKRIVLSGRDDRSDIEIDQEIRGVIEVKWRSPAATTKDPVTGRKPLGANNFTASQLEKWLQEATVEGANYGNAWCALFINRFGKGSPNDWHVYIPSAYSSGEVVTPTLGGLRVNSTPVAGAVLYLTGAQFMNWLHEEYGEVARTL